MNSIKTAVVVAILLGVLYGVYRVLNIPERPLTPSEQEMVGMDVPEINPGTPMNPMEPINPRDVVSPYKSGPEIANGGFKPEYGLDDHAPGMPAVAEQFPSRYPDLSRSFADKGNSAPQPSPGVELPPAESQDPPDFGVEAFRRAMQEAEVQVKRGRLREALEQLTVFYDAPSLTPEDQKKLNDWLDALAGKVIYSSEHQLEHPHIVRQGETLQQIADVYRVPAELLHNINRSKINNPNVLLPGSELKVVRGPFEARVSLDKEKLTLFLENGRYYAGQFRISVGDNPAPRPSQHPFRVKEIVPPQHRNNPYGDWWIDLGVDLAIHPITNSALDANAPNSIGLTSVDVADLATILEPDCKVLVRR